MSVSEVAITQDQCLPIPPDLANEPWLKPLQHVLVRSEGERLVVEKVPRGEVVANLARLCDELRTGEGLERTWAEVEAGRDDGR